MLISGSHPLTLAVFIRAKDGSVHRTKEGGDRLASERGRTVTKAAINKNFRQAERGRRDGRILGRFGVPFIVAMLLIGTQAPFALGQNAPHTSRNVAEAYGRLPLAFEENRGQAGSEVAFVARGRGYVALLNRGGDVTLAVRSSSKSGERFARVRMKPAGANTGAAVTGLDELSGKSNYLLGSDPARWRTNIQNFARVRYEEIYPGIDLIYYGNQGQLEYDFIVHPGADPNRIELALEGAAGMEVTGDGDVAIRLKSGELRLRKPVLYQEQLGARTRIEGSYILLAHNRVRFAVGKYDATRPLVIDPTLVYSTYLGGSSDDFANAIAIDSAGNAYLTGRTNSTNFPTANPPQPTLGSNYSDDVFVAKLNAAGTGLVYSTFLGGTSGDIALAIALDSAGAAYITGYTSSTNFPTTPGAFQTTIRGSSDAFIAKLNPSGTALAYSTYLGGNAGETGYGIAVDASGNAHLTGSTSSSDFPTTAGAFQTTSASVFVAKMNSTGSGLVYSTYLGGSSFYDAGLAIALDSGGNAYVGGSTRSSTFPTTPGAFDTTCGTDGTCNSFQQDGFVTKLNAAGTALIYSTFLGGRGQDGVRGLALDASGNAYLAGWTSSSDVPTANAFQVSLRGSQDAFAVILNAAGSALLYSTYLGGGGSETGWAVAVDADGSAYVVGSTTSSDFPTTPGALQTSNFSSDPGFVTKLTAAGTPDYSTYFAATGAVTGVVVDSAGVAYVAGYTYSSNFPTTPDAFQTAMSGYYSDAFVSKIRAENPVATLASLLPASAIAGGAGFSLTVNGMGFVAGAVVRWNGTDRPTVFVSTTQIAASVYASDIASTGSASVTVFDPGPGGGISNALTFRILPAGSNPVATVTSLSPARRVAGGPDFLLTVRGANFISGSVVRWNGAARSTTFAGSTELRAFIPAADLASVGAAQVSVFNPAPGGVSNALTFTIGNPTPEVTGISPSFTTSGGGDFTLTITGTGFLPNSVVRWNGADRNTTFVSAAEVHALVFAADIAAAGTAVISVFNPTPGGGLSNALNFSIAAPGSNPVPAITSIAPANAVAGTAGFTLVVNGFNFTAVSVIRWNGADRPTTPLSGSQLQAVISASDVVVSGIAQVTVFNPGPGGGTSNTASFRILPPGSNPVPVLTSLSPASVRIGSTPLTMTINGSGFTAQSAVSFSGNVCCGSPATYVSGTQLRVTLSWLGSTPETVGVTVFNPSPGGGTSNTLTFDLLPQIPNPVPTLTSISPSSAMVGGPAFPWLPTARTLSPTR